MGTIAPNESRELCEKVQAAGGEYLESPVLGSIPQVKAGELILMVGATAAQYERWLPLAEVLWSGASVGRAGGCSGGPLSWR